LRVKLTWQVGAPLTVFAATFAMIYLPVVDGPRLLGYLAIYLQVFFAVFAAMLLLAGGVIGILLLLGSLLSSRLVASRAAAVLLISCSAATLGGVVAGDVCRSSAFPGLAQRLEPLIHAIEAYQHDKGDYPESLEQLVPHYLKRIPETGMAGYPHLFYERPPHDRRAANGDAYELRVPCGYLLSFDVFVYWPQGDYPDYMYGGGVEKIGGWAYVHE